MLELFKVSSIIFLFLATISVPAQHSETSTTIDVLKYTAEVEPGIANGTIQGKVIIQFLVVGNDQGPIRLDCGNLIIESVKSGKLNIPFERANSTLLLQASTFNKDDYSYEVEIRYHGKPSRGINFFPALEEVYTVFSTSQWLVCKDAPDDKAAFHLSLIMPTHLQVIATGELVQNTLLNNHKTRSEWHQKIPSPTYTFGFVAGPFTQYAEQPGRVKFQYLAKGHSEKELKQIFSETSAILHFFEDRSGVPYPGNVYSQLLTEGNVSQEMAGFSILRNNYGKQVLSNASEINLMAHEFAHQWWGNQVTCLNWNHFWLNEGLAVFMSSAYKEHRFGREEYLKDIDIYFKAYQKVADKGLDKPLVFKDWLNPTPDDRTLVYYKGAYVFHLLREELGDHEFWAAIKLYTTSNFGKSVISSNLQDAMQETSKKDLHVFFTKWID